MYGWRKRIGLCLPANNIVTEPELARLAPEGVSLHSARMIMPGDFEPRSLDEMQRQARRAAEELKQSQVDVIVYACMSTCIVEGVEWERAYEAQSDPKLIYISAAQAVVRALHHLGAKRVAVLSPYPPSIQPYVRPFFAESGFTVVQEAHRPIADIKAVVRVTPQEVYRWARSTGVPAEAEALCILATDLRTMEVVDTMERDFGLPVITCNLALLWDALRSGRVKDAVSGAGTLLES